MLMVIFANKVFAEANNTDYQLDLFDIEWCWRFFLDYLKSNFGLVFSLLRE